MVTFDENGFTADHEFFLSLTSDEDFVWTIQLNGLTGASTIEGSVEGEEFMRSPVNEGAF